MLNVTHEANNVTPEQKKKFTEGLFQQAQLTARYMEELFTSFKAILGKKPHEETIFGLFGRCVCILKTLTAC
jgi:hypothetical protein